MKEWIYKNISGRSELINKLVDNYMDSSASEVSVILGNHGSGKSYVLFEVIRNILKKNNLCSSIQIYVPDEDKLLLQNSSNDISIDSIEASISLPIHWGIGFEVVASASKKNSESQFNHIYNLLKKRFSSDILICIPNYSEQDNKIKLLVKVLVENLQQLKKIFKHKLFFLIDNLDESCLNDFMECSTIDKIILEDYEEKDIWQYLMEKHKLVLNEIDVREKLNQIKRICASNLKLVDFLYVDFVEQDLDFFRALDSVVSYRLNQLKKDGTGRNVSEYDMEDIILTSSLSLKNFGSHEIAMITNKQTDTVRESLLLAQKQIFLEQNSLHFYKFTCEKIQEILRKELTLRNRERYLDYYNYYSLQEQDQYYLRAYYLWVYNSCIRDDVFALLILAYSNALSFNDLAQITKIEKIIYEDQNSRFSTDYNIIKSFYNMLRKESADYVKLKSIYMNLQKDYFDIPLKAELTRAIFCFMFKNFTPWNLELRSFSNQIVQYVMGNIYLSLSEYPIKINLIDETVLRLRLIYDISPYVLDSINDVQLFQELYDLSRKLSNSVCISQSSRSIAKYMENVFNRKAFLFVNQMQCNIFYDKAKKYFYDNNIWDEYCITLICEAGTNIVIQKYEEALLCCRKAKRISLEKGVLIPQPEKLMNNIIIADFFRYEQTHSSKKCFVYSQKAAKKLRKYLLRRPCATEFVIITNICSLFIYSGNIHEYCSYKRYLERLMGCDDVSNISDEDVDDFYRYYFAWFEAYKYTLEEEWKQAERIACDLEDFVPSLFKKQEVFWDKKLLALKEIITAQRKVNGYDFCKNLVPLKRRASELAVFFCRGLMLSDLQYTSYD